MRPQKPRGLQSLAAQFSLVLAIVVPVVRVLTVAPISPATGIASAARSRNVQLKTRMAHPLRCLLEPTSRPLPPARSMLQEPLGGAKKKGIHLLVDKAIILVSRATEFADGLADTGGAI